MKWIYLLIIFMLNALLILMYKSVDFIEWLNNIYIKIFLHITITWIIFLLYINKDSSINYDHKGQYLTKELIEEYKKQNILDNESCLDA